MNKVDWSPDGRYILIGTNNLELQIFDNLGNFMRKVQLTTLQSIYDKGYHQMRDFPKIVCINWYKGNGHVRPLMIALEDGCILLMKNENDSSPIIFDSEMRLTSARWNYTGDTIAVTGKYQANETSQKNCLKLYNIHGVLVHMTKVPGNDIYDCAWHKFGVKLGLAVDAHIFFATIKPFYHWAYMTNSIVFVTNDFSDTEASKRIVFLDVQHNRLYEKDVHNFALLTSWQFNCAVVTRTKVGGEATKKPSGLTIYNSVGTPIDRTVVNLEVMHTCMNSTRMIVAGESSFLVWNFAKIPNYKNTKSMVSN